MDYFLLHGGGHADAQSGSVHRWLAGAIRELGVLVAETGGQDAFLEQIGAVNPELVFVRFASSPVPVDALGHDQKLGEGRDAIGEATQLVAQLTRLFPGLPLVAVGSAADGRAMLAALRAGVKDFIDTDGAPAEAVRAVRRLLAERASTEPTRRGRVLAILGARPGVGATTLAANLATLVRRTSASDVMLLDLGQPLRDGALYLNVPANFHFVEAVRNLRRFDQVFVQTALSRHPSGLAVLPLPISLAEMRDISFSEALGLLNRLRTFFDLQVVDLGGFNNLDFIAQLVKAADDVMLVTEQSVGAIVSAAELLQELKKREIDSDHLHLAISKFDARLSLDAAQIAERLEIASVMTVPSRRQALVVASNQGTMLAETHPSDPYVRALAQIAQQFGYAGQIERRTGVSAWMAGARARLGGRFKRKSADQSEQLDLGTTERNAT
ncbi:AAA family ATPase [Ralstonia sp. UBA689]|uniref:AAA family ATPase n=1 Tax=Ralstonia sp. UBA689 TaxID=1947373 RepID=UPI0025F105CE|nr:CpaE family protein [Ralstonia sp. UBA689]